MFFESASEERDHAIKIIGYLLMRGGLTKDIGQLIRDPVSMIIWKSTAIGKLLFFLSFNVTATFGSHMG